MALPNPNLAKIHRNYSVEDIASLFGLHKNTVRAWIKNGLPVIDKARPMLILGSDLRAYLKDKRQSKKSKCKPTELYCVSCKAPKKPALDMVEFKAAEGSTGCLIGLCPECDSVMNKFCSQENLKAIQSELEVTITTN